MEEFVKLKDITKVYHMGEVEIRAADNINFSIKKGEFVVIVGPSGAGKTTVLIITRFPPCSTHLPYSSDLRSYLLSVR